jgi:dolichol-phosphate mannosyltransferase
MGMATTIGGTTGARATPRVSIVVPTLNEADNVEPLLEALACALRAHDVEVLFVDDSVDATPERIVACASRSPLRVRLIHRPEGERVGGLAGAVAAGIDAAAGDSVCVIDADLQHPPGVVPLLIAEAERSGADVVVGTRYTTDGAASGFGPVRHAVSTAATLSTRVLFPRRLARVHDPMSGLFLVRRSAVETHRLRPRGFKILLEILVRARRRLVVAEVPYTFGVRRAGQSKAGAQVGLGFVVQLVELRLGIGRTRGASMSGGEAVPVVPGVTGA